MNMLRLHDSDKLTWKLENGTPITAGELADEIAMVPRTRFWRLSHLVMLWPESADPDSAAEENGFTDGFVLELVPVPDGIEWLLQPTNTVVADRQSGRAANGHNAIMAAFRCLEQIVADRSAKRHKTGNR